MSQNVAVVKWNPHDEIANEIQRALRDLGYNPVLFKHDEPIPEAVDFVFSFAPYGPFLQIPSKLAQIPFEKRPKLIHWNTQSVPDPRVPWPIVWFLSTFRSWTDRLSDTRGSRFSVARLPLSLINNRLYKYRFVGDYHYAYRKGWLDLFADMSFVHAELHRKLGLPVTVVPLGTPQKWYADLDLKRDIDVVWMGRHRTKRRSRLLKQIREQLERFGVKMHVFDGIENPFIFGERRVQLLNRTKVTLNLLPTWYDANFYIRFHVVAGNRSLVISEPFLSHYPGYVAGQHYVSANPESLVETILAYLENENERERITQNAYELVTTQFTFENSIKAIMLAAAQKTKVGLANA
jgi:hypothetical protein